MLPTALNKNVKDYIHMAIREELQDLLSDPDVGLEMKESFKKKLRKSRTDQLVSSQEVAKRLGLRKK